MSIDFEATILDISVKLGKLDEHLIGIDKSIAEISESIKLNLRPRLHTLEGNQQVMGTVVDKLSEDVKKIEHRVFKLEQEKTKADRNFKEGFIKWFLSLLEKGASLFIAGSLLLWAANISNLSVGQKITHVENKIFQPR